MDKAYIRQIDELEASARRGLDNFERALAGDLSLEDLYSLEITLAEAQLVTATELVEILKEKRSQYQEYAVAVIGRIQARAAGLQSLAEATVIIVKEWPY